MAEDERKMPELRDPHLPRFPVIYANPTFDQVRANISTSEYMQSALLGGACFPMGYLVARQLDRSMARQGMWFTGILGCVGTLMLAYQNSQLRLQGFGRNDKEVQQYLQHKRSSE